jgi:NAD-dependent deacetylase
LHRHERHGVSRRWFRAQARAAGAHTVELNLKPSDGAELFVERIEGPAAEIVPAYVDMLLLG